MAADNRCFSQPRSVSRSPGYSHLVNERATPAPYGRPIDVQVLHWPAERDRRDELIRRREPRLLLVDQDGIPPSGDTLEDWVFVAASEREVAIRIGALADRARRCSGLSVDRDGVARRGSRSVPLSPLETRLVGALARREGAVVSREVLARAGWAHPPDRNVLDVHVSRLRRRLAPLGATIKTVRSRGYLLELSGSVQEYVPES